MSGPIEYITSSAPSAVLHGYDSTASRSDPLGSHAPSVEHLLVAENRVFAAQKGGALSVWDAAKRGAWQPLMAGNTTIALFFVENLKFLIFFIF